MGHSDNSPIDLLQPPEEVLEAFTREIKNIASRMENNIYVLNKKSALEGVNDQRLQGIELLLKAMKRTIEMTEVYLDHRKNMNQPHE